MTKLLKGNKGSSTIIFALTLTVIAGMSAFVMDIGLVVLEKQKLQNAVDATALAAAHELPNTSKAGSVANNYIQLNGYTPSDINITFSNSNKEISVTGTKTIEYTFAKVLGFDDATVISSATAILESIGGPFDYALFSGSTTDTLSLNGSNFYIDGSVHTNYKFVMTGSNQTITGACEAVSTIKITGSNNDVKVRVPDAPIMEMPDFSEMIRVEAEKAGQAYVGDKTFNSSNIDVNSPIYVDGDVTINGSSFTGKGAILATGNITFNGSNVGISNKDSVCIYSMNGNITLNGSGAVLDGVIYAPKGIVTMNGSNQLINGRVIAHQTHFNGGNSRIISGTYDLQGLPDYSIRLVK